MKINVVSRVSCMLEPKATCFPWDSRTRGCSVTVATITDSYGPDVRNGCSVATQSDTSCLLTLTNTYMIGGDVSSQSISVEIEGISKLASNKQKKQMTQSLFSHF